MNMFSTVSFLSLLFAFVVTHGSSSSSSNSHSGSGSSSDSSDDGDSSSTKCKKAIGWIKEPQCGLFGFTSAAGGLTSVDDSLYHVFGWEEECFDGTLCDNTYYSSKDIFEYSIKDGTWSSVTVDSSSSGGGGGGTPRGRVNFAVAGYDSDEPCSHCPKESIVVYGGTRFNPFFSNFTFFDDFWYFSLSDNEWHQITPDTSDPDNEAPGFLAGTKIVAIGNLVYLFGGISNAFSISNDLYYYSFVSNIWTRIVPENVANGDEMPAARWGMEFLHYEQDNELIVTIGTIEAFGTEAAGDVWAYSIDDNEWFELVASSGDIAGRTVAGGAVDQETGNVYVFFGDDENDDVECLTPNTVSQGQSIVDTTYVYSRDESDWILLSAPEFLNVVSPRLKRPSSVELDGKIYVMGGFDFVCDLATQMNGVALFNTQLYSLDIGSINV